MVESLILNFTGVNLIGIISIGLQNDVVLISTTHLIT